MSSLSTLGRHRLLVSVVTAAVGLGLPAPAMAKAADPCRTPTAGPIQNPLPGELKPGGLAVALTHFVTLPRTRPDRVKAPSVRPVASGSARINYIGEVPDGSGRLYVPDLNGQLYLIDKGKKRKNYLNVAAHFRDFQMAPGLGTGFGFVAFHPDFKSNRRFYTVHTEAGAALERRKPTLPLPDDDVEQHTIITEWFANSTRANRFTGRKREVLRIGLAAHKHAIQQIGFNPYAEKDSDDYGLLYIAVGDGEEDNTLSPEWSNVAQDLSRPHGKILRIDPLADDTRPYRVPDDNPFVGQGGALGEIYAYGLRDPHRFSWDPAGDHRMYLGAFGERRVEMVYEVRPGANFGWPAREGTFLFKGEKKDQFNVYALPPGDGKCGFTYPVASYGRDVNKGLVNSSGKPVDIVGISGGFVYRGDDIPALRGMYVFGDVVSGRVIYTRASEMSAGKAGVVKPQAKLHLLTLYHGGQQVTMSRLATGKENRRVDFRLGIDGRGELYFLAKANGTIWTVGKEGSK